MYLLWQRLTNQYWTGSGWSPSIDDACRFPKRKLGWAAADYNHLPNFDYLMVSHESDCL